MDILTRRGELSPEDLLELKAMSQEEVVAFVSGMSKSWYQLLESLEEAHRQDLERLRRNLTETFQAAALGFKSQLLNLEKSLESGTDTRKKNSERLTKLTNACEKLLKENAAGP